MDLEKYLKKNKFDKYFNRLTKKIKNKRIVIYGAGSLFQLIQKKYDLTEWNIIGISDTKYKPEDEGKEDLGYKIIPKKKIEDYEFDVLIISLQEYIGVLCGFSESLQNKKIIVLPLVRQPFISVLKKIWF